MSKKQISKVLDMKPYPFEHPDERYRGLDLWALNDKLEDDEIRKQVKEFAEKGLYSVVFRTFNGLFSDYPGPEFMHKVRVAIDAAREYGLKIAFQAGFMPSAYPALPKEFALHRIVPVPEAELGEDASVLHRYNGLAFTDQIVPATVNLLDSDSVKYYIRTAYEEMWSEFADEFGKTVISVWLDEPRFNSRYLTWSPDFDFLFSKQHGYSIQQQLHALYYDVGDYKKIRYDYFTFIRDAMEKNYYSQVRDWCHSHGLSFAGHLMGEEYLTTQISQATAVMPFYKYLDIPGVDMLSCNHDWYDKPFLSLPNNRRRVERSMHISAIQCTSAAEQAGKAFKLCEMYGVTGPGLNFRDMLYMFDFFAANGINNQCIHALFYSPRGFRKRFYPQAFNVYQPFWKDFKHVKDYVASASSFVSMGRSCTDVVVLHPLETAYGLFRGLYNPADESNRDVVNNYDNTYYRLIVQLYSSQIGFHFADPSTIDHMGKIDADRFCVGAMSYGTLVLADIEVLTEKCVDLISTFSENGGSIYIKGNIPCRLDGRFSPDLAERISALKGVRIFETNEDLVRALKQNTRQTWEYICDTDAAQTVINHRTDGKQNYFFVYNGDCRMEKKGRLVVEGCHKAYCFDASSKRVFEMPATYEQGKTVISFTNPVGGSTMIITAPHQETAATLSVQPAYSCRIPLQNITCNVAEKNVLTLELCRYKTAAMEDFSPKEIAIERVVTKLKVEGYSGDVTLRFTFHSDFCAKGLKLILEDVKDCRIKFNGVDVDSVSDEFYYSTAFSVLRLPDVVKVGENVIEISRYTEPLVALQPSDDMKHLFELFRSPRGVDMERIHLLGDFSVETTPEYSQAAGLVRVAKRFYIAPPKKLLSTCDATSNGYPFYPGAIEYTANVKIPADMLNAEQILLKIGRFNGCAAAVLLNGQHAGYIARDPYTLILPKEALIANGNNEIRFRLSGTFRNMFGPSHVADLDPANCGKVMWIRDFDFSDHTEYDIGILTNSFQLAPYGIGEIRLEFCGMEHNS